MEIDFPRDRRAGEEPRVARGAEQVTAVRQYDVFIDLSEGNLGYEKFPKYVENLALDAGLARPTASTMLVLPEGWDLPPGASGFGILHVGTSRRSDGLYRAIRRAARFDRHLAVILDALLPPNEALARLIEEFDRDPLFGMVQPRFADAADDHVWALPNCAQNDAQGRKLSRRGLSILPPFTITPELLAVCTVIRREVVREMDQASHGLENTIGEFRLLLSQARRRGFRNLVVNRAAITSELSYPRLYPKATKPDFDRINRQYPDILRADAWNANLAQRRLEGHLARAFASDAKECRRLLLDARGMIAEHNGTAHHILGILDGFQALDSAWQIDVMASSAATEFHRLRKRYHKFRLLHALPQETYSAAVLLNQPWGLSTVDELHQHALLIAFTMLDTISWDILYVCDGSLDLVWRFIARYSDGLFYISQFTCDRFRTRFPLQETIAERVTYLTMASDEVIAPTAWQEPVGDKILIFGNDYDHKDVRRTLQLLVDAFPFNKFIAFGIESTTFPNVTALPSGHMDQVSLHRMIAGARVIVFPSFYEGFGMPVVQGLAYGRPVIVRQSPLWEEIAGQLRLPGYLVPFDSTASLIEAVGCALAGLPLKALPQGTMLRSGESPLRWRDCAQRMIDLIEELMRNAGGRRWQEREEALQTIRLLRL
jgi:glycosyltransferase involved in cell wall biosynthesis